MAVIRNLSRARNRPNGGSIVNPSHPVLDALEKIRRILVHEGIRLDTLTEVFGDLSAADNVLVKPSEEIKTGKIN